VKQKPIVPELPSSRKDSALEKTLIYYSDFNDKNYFVDIKVQAGVAIELTNSFGSKSLLNNFLSRIGDTIVGIRQVPAVNAIGAYEKQSRLVG
jgi:hypothetical protein